MVDISRQIPVTQEMLQLRYNGLKEKHNELAPQHWKELYLMTGATNLNVHPARIISHVLICLGAQRVDIVGHNEWGK